MNARLLSPCLILWGLFLAGCSFSLTADITPPPPPSVPALLPSLSPVPSETAGSQAGSGPVEVLTTLSGSVVRGGVGTPLTGLIAALHITGPDTGEEAQPLTAVIGEDGSYRFSEASIPAGAVYWVTVEVMGVTYSSGEVTYDGATSQPVPSVTIYEAGPDIRSLEISQFHLGFDLSAAGVAQLIEVYLISNTSSSTVTVQAEGESVPILAIPDGAFNINIQLAEDSEPLTPAAGGFALLPGTEKPYVFVAAFALPCEEVLDLVQPFLLPAASVTVFIPEGIGLQSDQLTESGIQSFQDEDLVVYRTADLAAGQRLHLTLTDFSRAASGTGSRLPTSLLLAVGVAGGLLVAVSLVLLWQGRERTRSTGRNRPPGREVRGLLEEIITLDKLFEAGGISRKSYERRRAALKARLKVLL